MIPYEIIGYMIRNYDEAMTAAKRGAAKPLTITLPPEFRALIDEQAARELRTASEIIREALRHYYGIGQPTPSPSMWDVRQGPTKI